jgi:TetR/AcrR family transcriptional regulator, cholesterol catabolism regulator
MDRVELNSEITTKIAEIFLRYGIRSVSMDDLSQQLGISKKTLYQYFRDKEDLVNKVINYLMIHQEKGMEEPLQAEGYNAIEQLFLMSRFLTDYLSMVNPALPFDLKKYYPEIWKNVVDFKKQTIYRNFLQNMEKGISEGLYRKEINLRIIANIYVNNLEMFTPDNENMREHSFKEVFRSLFIYHIRGIASTSGLQYLEELIMNQEREKKPESFQNEIL